ncbi:MAG: methyltransferase [Desulfobacterales bacterium]|nr:methyltransferase [Desulfobacterales bacterium]
MERYIPDASMGSGLVLDQPLKGYRFSSDSLVLADCIKTRFKRAIHEQRVRHILDAGCGCGILSILLSDSFPSLLITGIEIQTGLFTCAKKNVAQNGLSDRIIIRHRDITSINPADICPKFDLMISNPPYKKKASGRLNPNSQKAVARHEIHLDIEQLFNCAKRLLTGTGRICLIFPAERETDLKQAMANYGFSPQFVQYIHTRKTAAPKRIILCAGKKADRAFIRLPPVIV